MQGFRKVKGFVKASANVHPLATETREHDCVKEEFWGMDDNANFVGVVVHPPIS